MNADLPAHLTITLWDFSWYTRAGDAYADLERCVHEAVERGYNTLRICAMPLLLFGDHDLPERSSLTVTGMGNGYGSESRWYDGRTSATFDPLQRLARLFELAREHDLFVIISSWEYQQSAALSATPAWYEMLEAIPYPHRFAALAAALNRMLGWLEQRRLADRIAYVELHNEIEYSRFGPDPATDPASADLHHDAVFAAVAALRRAHPEVLVTACYARPQTARAAELPSNLQVAHVHTYVYGVLGALDRALGLPPYERAGFPSPALRAMLPADVPSPQAHVPDGAWRLDASVLTPERAYVFDFIDPGEYDSWLVEHFGAWTERMRTGLTRWIEDVAGWADSLGVPAVLGEGYVGYTPLRSRFEMSPIGKSICEHAVDEALRCGYWGLVLCSNCAPNHPDWAEVEWQRAVNERISREARA